MRQKLTTFFLALCLTASLGFAQVDKLTGTVTNDATMARLRLAHFVFGGPHVDWYVDGNIAVNGGQEQINIPVGYVNGYLYLEPGTYSFTIVPTGKTADEALLETDVAVEAGHRYTLAMIGQLEDEKLSSLVLDETAELQKLGAAKDQQIYFVVNNLAGAETLDLDEDGHGLQGVPYGSFGVTPLPAGKFAHYAVTANGDPNAVIDSGDYSGYGERPGADVLLGFFGRFPGKWGEDFDASNASPSSDMKVLEFLQGFSGVGFEEDYQAITFETFLEAVEIAGLTDVLNGGDPLLVLPPTDAAFAELPKEQLDALMADPKALADVLRNHIAEAYVPKGALATTPGGPFDRSFTNLAGGTTHIGNGYTVNGLNVGDTSSTFTANGTQVHPITKVLLPSITLSLAVTDPHGRLSQAYVEEFIDQVTKLSDGRITIEPYWFAGTGREDVVIREVRTGVADLGLVGSRAFNGEGVINLDALQAPFLIDNDALAEAVAVSDTARQMLDGMSSAGVVGLTLWPEDMRHPFAIDPQPPFLSPEDLSGMDIRTTTSGISAALVRALGANPVGFESATFQGAESGLRQGGSLPGTQTATGNVTFFSKYQVLFANATSFEMLSDEQKSILREAALATQTKAIAEHPREADAATAYCADGGTVVLASDAQIAAFEQAARPVFDQIEQDPANAGYIAAIRALKASTTPSAGAAACEPPATQAGSTPSSDTEGWSEGLPPNGIWQVELSAADLEAVGLPQASAVAWASKQTLTLRDGEGTWFFQRPEGNIYCKSTYAVVDDVVRFDYTADCTGQVHDLQWRLEEDGLHLNIVATQRAFDAQFKASFAAKPWQNIGEPTPDTRVWGKGLPPNGTWQAEATPEDFLAMGFVPSYAALLGGVYTWTFQDGKATFHSETRDSVACTADYAVVGDVVRFNYTGGNCARDIADMQWRLDDDGLHMHIVDHLYSFRADDLNLPSVYLDFSGHFEANTFKKIE